MRPTLVNAGTRIDRVEKCSDGVIVSIGVELGTGFGAQTGTGVW